MLILKISTELMKIYKIQKYNLFHRNHNLKISNKTTEF